MIPREYIIKTNSATEALYILFSVLVSKEKKIAHTDSMCYSVSQAIISAELKSNYLDIEIDTLNIKPSVYLLEEKTSFILGVHGYGYSQDFSYLNQDNLVEDASLTWPLKGNKVGTFGVASVFSFGGGKPYECGSGGLIGTDDLSLYNQILNFQKKIKRVNYNEVNLSRKHTKLYNDKNLSKFKSILNRNSFEFISRKPCNTSLKEISEYIIENQKKIVDSYNDYQTKFKSNSDYTFFKLKEGDHPWRFNYLMNSNNERDLFLKKNLDLGNNVSSWHMSLSSYLEESFPLLENSLLVSNQISNINLKQKFKKLVF